MELRDCYIQGKVTLSQRICMKYSQNDDMCTLCGIAICYTEQIEDTSQDGCIHNGLG